jgi:hypothetical protein
VCRVAYELKFAAWGFLKLAPANLDIFPPGTIVTGVYYHQ